MDGDVGVVWVHAIVLGLWQCDLIIDGCNQWAMCLH